MALIETGDSSTGVANVDSNYNLKVAYPAWAFTEGNATFKL